MPSIRATGGYQAGGQALRDRFEAHVLERFRQMSLYDQAALIVSMGREPQPTRAKTRQPPKEPLTRETLAVAWDYVCEWLIINDALFDKTLQRKVCLGIKNPIEGTDAYEYLIICRMFEKALKAQNFPYRACVKGFLSCGYLQPHIDYQGQASESHVRRIGPLSERVFIPEPAALYGPSGLAAAGLRLKVTDLATKRTII